MSRRRWILIALLLVFVVGVVWLSGGGPPTTGPSSLSASASGWLAARRYLEDRGRSVTLRDEPFSASRSGSLVTAFPWEAALSMDEETAIRGHLSSGGDLVVGYSGEQKQSSEIRLFEILGMNLQRVRGDLPLSPIAWYRYRIEQWRLTPDRPASADPASVVVRAPRSIPAAPAGARVLYRAPGGEPAIFLLKRGGGRVFVLPSDAFANARISGQGNADLLESLTRVLPAPLVFDEYHHGLSRPAAASPQYGLSFDLLITQLALVYVLVVLALAKRLGEPWKEMPVRTGSTAAFLMALAVRHRRLGHFREAGKLLFEAIARLDPSFAPSRELLSLADGGSEAAFLAAAIEVSAAQRHGRVGRSWAR